MYDRREAILDRLVTIAGTLTGIKKVYRNVDSNPEILRPAAIILDGEETAADIDERLSRVYGISNVVVLSPTIILIAAGNETTMANTIATMRMELMAAVLNDATLISLITTNGYVRYDGCTMTDAYGYTLQGEMKVRFQLRYPILSTDYV